MLKYNEIAQSIEKMIVEKNLKQGTKLPNFQEMIQNYGVSKSTIVKALTILEQKGVIYQIQGSGVFVRRRKKAGYINFIENQGFTADLEEFNITSKVLAFEKTLPDLETKNNLLLDSGEKVYRVKRIRYVNEQILCLEESFYRESVVSYLDDKIASGSLFKYLKNALKLNIGFSDKYLHVIKLRSEQATALELKKNDPSLFVEELFYLSSGKPFDFSRTFYHYEHSQFFFQSNNLNS